MPIADALRPPHVWCVALLLVPLLAPHSVGAAGAAKPWRLDEALGLPERLSIEGDFRIRYEYIDNQFRAGRPGKDELLPLRTRVRVRLSLLEWLTIGAEFQDSRSYLADDNTQINTGMVNAAELLRAYLELSGPGPLGGAQTLQLGRMTMDVGSRRLVARNGFRNTSNAFTGIDWRWHNQRGRSFRAFYVLPISRLPDEPDRIRRNEVKFDEEDSDFQFFGLLYGDRLPWDDLVEVYLYGVYEDNVFDPTEPESLDFRRFLTPEFRLLREPEEGRFDYEFESIIQAGKGRKPGRTRVELDHFAHFQHVAIGYTFRGFGSPRLSLHYDYASGDRDPFDSSNQRFDGLFGGRRFDLGPTRLYGPWARANLNTPGLRVQFRPGAKLQAMFDYRAVWLAEARDEWVGSGVRDPTGQSGTYVGSQIELKALWRPFPGNAALEAGYAHLFAGEFIDNAPDSNGGDSNYVYVQLTLAF